MSTSLSNIVGKNLAQAGSEYSDVAAEVGSNYSDAYSNMLTAFSASSATADADLKTQASNMGITEAQLAKFTDAAGAFKAGGKEGLVGFMQKIATEGMKRASQVMDLLSNLLDVISRTKQRLVDAVRV